MLRRQHTTERQETTETARVGNVRLLAKSYHAEIHRDSKPWCARKRFVVYPTVRLHADAARWMPGWLTPVAGAHGGACRANSSPQQLPRVLYSSRLSDIARVLRGEAGEGAKERPMREYPEWLVSTLASDAAEGRGVLPNTVAPLSGEARVVAPARVALMSQDDNLAVREAIDQPEPGTVLVVAGGSVS